MELKDYKEVIIAAITLFMSIATYFISKRKGKGEGKGNDSSAKKLSINGDNNQQTDQHGNAGMIIGGSGHKISITSQGNTMESNDIEEHNAKEPMNKQEIRDKKKLLFIDDQPYSMTKLLQRNGWKNVKLVKDINRIDDDDVTEADIILVDIIGVGASMGFQDQGLGLAQALKDEYQSTKKIIIYSQEEKGDRFHPALNKADKCVKKDSSVYQLEKTLFELFGAK